jgi:hypothetical protein
MKAQLVRAEAEAAASKSKHEESDKCITELEAQIVNGNSSEAAPLGGGPWEVVKSFCELYYVTMCFVN